MRATLISLFLILAGYPNFGQIHFSSKNGLFTVIVPVNPEEIVDTIQTKFGRFPRYLMMAQTVGHGATVMYVVEILDWSGSKSEINLDNLKSELISRKASAMSFTLVKESEVKEPGKPYQTELVFTDGHGGAVNFVRFFIRNSKCYTIETFESIGAMKLSNKPNKSSREYFQSLVLIN